VAEIVVRGHRVHYRRLGAGERTVVFVHGLVMDNLSSWYFTLANPAATVAEVLLYDVRGHGASERTPTGYTVPELVADLAALGDALGLGGRRLDLVANSFGGLVALGFALAHPERTASLVLIDANMSDEDWSGRIRRDMALEGAERDALIVRYAYKWAGRNSERKSTRLARSAEELVYRTSLPDDLAASPPLGDDELRRIRCPVLALYGEDSELADRGERLARVLPACELRRFPGCTHLLLWEATEALKRELVGWLTRPQSPGRVAGARS
jgi:pimeloyl-ACP methyl ester carboxylesterase